MASDIVSRALAAAIGETPSTLLKQPIPLTPREALSGVFGAISLTAWIFVNVPQLVENYREGSAEALSIFFILIWLVGDAANLIGAVWAKLIPTTIAIGAYFVFSSLCLVGQWLYYYLKNERRRPSGISNGTMGSEPNEEEPLLSRRASNQSFGLPGSQKRRRSSAASRSDARGSFGPQHGNPMVKIDENDTDGKQTSATREAVKNTLCILLICVIGAAGWAICWKIGAWKPTPTPEQQRGKHGDDKSNNSTPLGAEIFGYISAVLYVGARIPQIIKNYRQKSCEGLSLLFFMLSLMGNLTYGAQILAHSLERNYIITNIPWLIGSLGTMAEDVTIFVQFHIYGDQSKVLDSAGDTAHVVE